MWTYLFIVSNRSFKFFFLTPSVGTASKLSGSAWDSATPNGRSMKKKDGVMSATSEGECDFSVVDDMVFAREQVYLSVFL